MGNVKKISRTACVACENSLANHQHLHTFVDFPVYMGISTNASTNEDLVEDMTWVACANCGTVQLLTLIDPGVLYQRPHNPSIGSTWLKHHIGFAEFVLQHSGRKILEIGGGNKILQKELLKGTSVEKYTVCDVHSYKTVDEDSRVSHITNYVSTDSDLRVECDTIVHSHTFEHFYNPIEQIKNFSSLLDQSQKMIMSVPNIKNITRDKFTNGLNFEHTFLLSERNFRHMLNKAGFEIESLVDYSEHNIFASCVKQYTGSNKDLDLNLEEQALFMDFVKFHIEEAQRIHKIISDANKPVFLFGCHIFSQYLLSFGIQQKHIKAILDNDPAKIGNRLYGTDLFTYSPKMLATVNEPVVILKAGIYTDEIMKDIVDNCNSKTKFIL